MKKKKVERWGGGERARSERGKERERLRERERRRGEKSGGGRKTMNNR